MDSNVERFYKATLKAVEPHVLDLSELRRGLGTFVEVYTESDLKIILGDDMTLSAIDRCKTEFGTRAFDFLSNDDPSRALYLHDYTYGSVWRCWSGRPTLERAKAVAWE